MIAKLIFLFVKKISPFDFELSIPSLVCELREGEKPTQALPDNKSSANFWF